MAEIRYTNGNYAYFYPIFSIFADYEN